MLFALQVKPLDFNDKVLSCEDGSWSASVIVGDARLIEKLRHKELIPLSSLIRTHLATEHASRDELLSCLNHLLAGAGNASLVTPTLLQTLCDLAAGNFRTLTTLRWRPSVIWRNSARSFHYMTLLNPR